MDVNGYREVSRQSGERYLHGRGSTFAFRKRWGQIDWKSLASIDVDRIAREVDFQALQKNIVNVTFCNIESEEFYHVDPNFIKLFRLAQLIIEYLLHTQQYLSEQGDVFEQKLQDVQQELEASRASLSSKEEELKAVKKENRKRRKVIEAYQDMMNAGATGLHACPVCRREFVSAEYLQAHIHRRHPEHLPAPMTTQDDRRSVFHEELEKKLLEQVNEKVQATEEQLRQEMIQKDQETAESQARKFEEWKQKEQEKMEYQMQAFKEPILAELATIQQEKAQMEEELQRKQVELEALQAKKPSHLGHLEDAMELDLGKAEVAHKTSDSMKEQLEAQAQEMQRKLQKQEKSWQKRMQKHTKKYQDQLRESFEKMQSVEQGAVIKSKQQEEHMAQQLRALQKTVKQQEKQLAAQQHQLLDVTSRNSSPVPTADSPVHSPLLPPSQIAEAANMAPDSATESGEESPSEDSQEVHEVEEVDFQGFTPFPQRPMIRTKYDHRPEILENVRQETQGILDDALVQRGLPKSPVGLTTAQFEDKLRSLKLERQQRTQAHYNFMEHREKLSEEVDTIATTNCTQKSKKHNANALDPAPGRSSSRPPKPTTVTRQSASHPPIVTVKSTVTHQTAPMSSLQAKTAVDPHPLPSPIVSPSDSGDSGSEWESNSEQDPVGVGGSSSPASPTVAAPSEPTPVEMIAARVEEDSPWDSEDDSIEELAAEHLRGYAASTPVKVKTLGASITLQPDPSKKPSGGIPLFSVPLSNASLESDSDDSFDITDSNATKGAAQLKKSLNLHESELHSTKAISRTATSRSALTTVSVADFEDSDISDLDITRLT